MEDDDSPKQKVSEEKKKYYQKHRAVWESDPKFQGWLTKSNNSEFRSFCKVCYKEIQAGKTDLVSHAKTTKHKKRMAEYNGEDLGLQISDEWGGSNFNQHLEDEEEEMDKAAQSIEIYDDEDDDMNKSSTYFRSGGSTAKMSSARRKVGRTLDRPGSFERHLANKINFVLDRVDRIHQQPLGSRMALDELQHFGMGIAEDLKDLEPTLQNNARRWISEILFCAKKGTLPEPPSMFDTVQFGANSD